MSEKSDIAVIGEILKAESQTRRANNRLSSPDRLREAGIRFVGKSEGVHLIVDGRVDFWPGTGLWIVRNSTHGFRGRGVFSLIEWVQRTKKEGSK